MSERQSLGASVAARDARSVPDLDADAWRLRAEAAAARLAAAGAPWCAMAIGPVDPLEVLASVAAGIAPGAACAVPDGDDRALIVLAGTGAETEVAAAGVLEAARVTSAGAACGTAAAHEAAGDPFAAVRLARDRVAHPEHAAWTADVPLELSLRESDDDRLDELGRRRGRSPTGLLAEALALLRAGPVAPAVCAEQLTAGDVPALNVARIRSDSARIASGRALLAEALAALPPDAGVAVVLLDLDSSAEIRREGIDAKVELVLQVRDVVADAVPDGAVLVDSGTRDELYVAVPVSRDGDAVAIAHGLRAAIRDGRYTVRGHRAEATACAGVAHGSAAGGAMELAGVARDALVEAKRAGPDRTAAVHGPAKRRRRTVMVDERDMHALDELVRERDRRADEVVADALAALFERHSGVWHWAVERWPAYAALGRRLTGAG